MLPAANPTDVHTGLSEIGPKEHFYGLWFLSLMSVLLIGGLPLYPGVLLFAAILSMFLSAAISAGVLSIAALFSVTVRCRVPFITCLWIAAGCSGLWLAVIVAGTLPAIANLFGAVALCFGYAVVPHLVSSDFGQRDFAPAEVELEPPPASNHRLLK